MENNLWLYEVLYTRFNPKATMKQEIRTTLPTLSTPQDTMQGPPFLEIGRPVAVVMARVLCVLVVWLVSAVCADSPAVVKEVDYLESLAPDLEYKTVASEDYPLEKDSGLEWLAKVTSRKGELVDGVSPTCSENMKEYWKALQKGEFWASQIYDANGRYSSQLLFGNSFWLGSMSLCYEVSSPKFNVSFRVAKLHISLPTTLTSKTTTVSLGICQPDSCTLDDTQIIINSTLSPTNNNDSLKILNVRKVPGDYLGVHDRRFQALSGSILVIAVLIVIGTVYEVMQTPQADSVKDVEKKGENNNAFESNEENGRKFEKNANNKEADNQVPSGMNELSKDNTRTRKGIPIQFILAFSAVSNGRRILGATTSSEDSLKFIHGLRFFSLTWVILVHTYLQLFAIGGNRMVRVITERSFMYPTIGNATFSVDTFFFISGLLVAYLFNRQMLKDPKTKNANCAGATLKFLKLIFYRFIRLTPVYLIVLCFVQLTMTFIRSSSVFDPNIMDDLNCRLYWWRNILYINNLFPKSEMCMVWSWYLAADVQFFTLATLVLILSKRKFKIAAFTLGAILVGAWCTTMFVSYTNQYEAKIQAPFDLFDELYDKPWTRIGPYIAGMTAGWYISKPDRLTSLPLVVVIVGWLLSSVGLLSLIFGIGSGLSVPVSAIYVSLGHTAWGIFLAWVAIACQLGHGGVINWILSRPFLYPMSRLTFCAYLVHPVIMMMTSFVMDGPFHIHNGLIVIIFLGNTVAAFLLAFLLALFFEAPVVRLLKLIVH